MKNRKQLPGFAGDAKAFDAAIKEIKKELDAIWYVGDLDDIGNCIGFAIAKHFSGKIGDEDDFMHGLQHGIDLIKRKDEANK